MKYAGGGLVEAINWLKMAKECQQTMVFLNRRLPRLDLNIKKNEIDGDITMELELLKSIAESLKVIAENMEKKNEMNDRIIQWMDKFPEFKEFMIRYNCCGYHD